MKALYAEFAQPGKTYTHADIVRVAKQVGGVDLDPLLQRIVATTTPFDLKPVMAEMGFDYEHFLFMLEHDITPRPDATAAQKQRFRDIFGFAYR
jgi:predicted metalloprotease with PDZ domain